MRRVVTSFSCSLLEAQAIAEATRHVKNRSAWIVDAIRKKMNAGELILQARDASTVYLLNLLAGRGDLSIEQRNILTMWRDNYGNSEQGHPGIDRKPE